MAKSIILTSIVALFLCISFNKTACTQGIVSEENQWNVLIHEMTSFYKNTLIYTIDDDSTLNSYEYKRMWAYNYLYGTFFEGLLREDANRVYYIYPGDAEEGLLYDFNAEIGDTCYIINVFDHEQAFPVYITNIDTTEYFDVERKRWFLMDDYGNEDFWIAGIGSSYGPVHNMVRHSVAPYWDINLLCYYHSNTLLYRKEGYSTCIITQVGIDEASTEKDIHIYPNPARDKFKVRSMEFGVEEIELYNISGRSVFFSEILSDKNSFEVHVKDIAPGMYFCRLRTSGFAVTKKILIQR